MKKMKVGYLRVSSDEQREKQTIETQLAELLKFCDARGLKLDKIYKDDGVSGKIPLARREPGGSELMRDAEAGSVEEIYVVKFDRLGGRKTRHFLNLHHRLEQLEVGVVSTTQPISKDATGRMTMQMLGIIAEWDRENILATTMSGLKHKAAAGGWTGGPVPFGYRVEGEKRTARLALHEEYSKTVLRLFERAASGESCRVLADQLNELGVPTSRQNPGSLWRPNSVRVILTNPIYTGTRLWGRRQ